MGFPGCFRPSISNSLPVYRKDRSESRGGGVIIAVKKELVCSFVDIHSSLEILWVTVRLDVRPSLIGVCYRLPGSTSHFVETLNANLEQLQAKFPNCPVILAGDFNIPGIK